MRPPRISVGAAIVAIAVAGTTASAFAVAGKVPSPITFQSASSNHESAVAATPSTTTPTSHHEPVAPAVRHERPVTAPSPAQPASEPVTTAPASQPVPTPLPHEVQAPVVPAPVAPEAGRTGEPPHATTTTAPAHSTEPERTTPTTASARPAEPERSTTTTAPAATTPTTTPAAAPATGERTTPLPVTMKLDCINAVSGTLGTATCTWTPSDSPAFASYRLFRTTATGAGQILFSGKDRGVTVYVDRPLQIGETRTYTVQALDAAGHVLATSAQVVATCCSQTPTK